MNGPPRGMFQFTGPGPVTSDPLFAYVGLLLHMDGTNGASVFTDSSSYGRTVSLTGLPTTDTSQFKYGVSSAKFVGASSQMLRVAVTTSSPVQPFSQLTGESIYSTMECWFRITDTTVGFRLAADMNGAFGSGSWGVYMNYPTVGNISFYHQVFSAGTPLLVTSGKSYNDGAWHHFAITKAGSSWTMWVDGISVSTGTLGGLITGGSTTLTIGGDTNFGAYLTGWVDEFRITKSDVNAGGTTSTARYTTTFTPSGPFPNS